MEILIHGVDNRYGADLSCPFTEWMGEDLVHCPGFGEWKCNLQEYRYAGDQYGLDSKDYRACKVIDHSVCHIYLNNGGK